MAARGIVLRNRAIVMAIMGGEPVVGVARHDKREEIERTLATVNPAELVRRIHDIQDRLEDMAAPRTTRLARRSGPDMAYLSKTLARIAGVEPEDNETPPADKD